MYTIYLSFFVLVIQLVFSFDNNSSKGIPIFCEKCNFSNETEVCLTFPVKTVDRIILEKCINQNETALKKNDETLQNIFCEHFGNKLNVSCLKLCNFDGNSKEDLACIEPIRIRVARSEFESCVSLESLRPSKNLLEQIEFSYNNCSTFVINKETNEKNNLIFQCPLYSGQMNKSKTICFMDITSSTKTENKNNTNTSSFNPIYIFILVFLSIFLLIVGFQEILIPKKIKKSKKNDIIMEEEEEIEIIRSKSRYENEFTTDFYIFNFKSEFQDIYDKAFLLEMPFRRTTFVAQLQENKSKNRCFNILPFDQTRVILRGNDNDTDYINASFIPFEDNEDKFEYIACQGPLEETLSDFWLMIWEQKISIIVMLTRVYEDIQSKCYQYWPKIKLQPEEYGDNLFLLQVEEEEENEIFCERKFKIIKMATQEERIIIHLQMQTWTDHSVPKLEDFRLFMFHFRQLFNANRCENTLVHCSAGVGRTGTFIAIDRIIRKLINGIDDICVYGEVLNLRKYRKFMVQRQVQYNFIHEFVQYFLKKQTENVYGIADTAV